MATTMERIERLELDLRNRTERLERMEERVIELERERDRGICEAPREPSWQHNEVCGRELPCDVHHAGGGS